MNNEELNKIIEENNLTFVAKMSIHKRVFISLYGTDRPIGIRYNAFLRTLEQRIQIIPLLGGGLNPDLEYEFVVVLKNTEKDKGVWNNSSWNNPRIELKLIEEVKKK